VGLCSALEQYLEGFTKRSGIETVVQLPPRDSPRFKPELETAIFRIIQEALTNVFRHSGARKAWITVVTSESQTAVTVRDDGKGLMRRVQNERPGHWASPGRQYSGRLCSDWDGKAVARLDDRDLHACNSMWEGGPLGVARRRRAPSPNPYHTRGFGTQPHRGRAGRLETRRAHPGRLPAPARSEARLQPRRPSAETGNG